MLFEVRKHQARGRIIHIDVWGVSAPVLEASSLNGEASIRPFLLLSLSDMCERGRVIR